MLKAEANRRVRMCNLQSAKDCASVKTSLATVRARAQEWGTEVGGRGFIWGGYFRAGWAVVRLSQPGDALWGGRREVPVAVFGS